MKQTPAISLVNNSKKLVIDSPRIYSQQIVEGYDLRVCVGKVSLKKTLSVNQNLQCDLIQNKC